MTEHGESEVSFMSAMTLTLESDENIPERYILPPLQRPITNHPSTNFPIVDLSLLRDPLRRSQAINEIHSACNKLGFFQVVNHGIPISVMQDALDTAKDFFHLPTKEKMQFASANVREPVRYGTSIHSLPIEKKVGPAPQLVDEQYPIAYREGSFGEFLDHISNKCVSETRYIDTLKVM